MEGGSAGVSFGLLGPFEVRVAGALVVITGGRRRALLARLLIDANRVVPADRLVEDLWADRSPEHPANALQAYISHLRAVLEPSRASRAPAGVLLTRRPGYLLAVRGESLDSTRFTGLVDEGQAALGGGQAADAEGLLGEALGLWRGPPLAEFADEGWARLEVARLVDLRWGAVEGHLEAELVLGRHASVVGEAKEACAEQPLRERLWAHRVLALYRCGRQAEALRACAELRRFLRSELGLEPSPALVRLEAAIRVQEPELDWRPERPRVPVRGPLSVGGPPPLLRQSGSLPLVGRVPELARLGQAWADTGRGGRAVLLAGEPGVGKTRLASEFGTDRFGDGTLVLAGRCDEEMGVPYQPFVEALRGFVGSTSDDELASRLGPGAAELTRVLPELSGRLPHLGSPVATDPATERYRLFVAFAGWLAAASCAAPVLLVIDDLHWATKPTYLLLRHILRSPDAMRLLVVATYRDTEQRDRSTAEEMAALAREPGVVELRLEGLGEDEVADLIAAGGGNEVEGGDRTELARAIHVATRGNPFFVGEVVRHLLEAEAASPGSAGSGRDLGIPSGVRAVVADRLARLEPATRLVLSVAAVAGLDFELPVVQLAADGISDTVIGALEEATMARLVEETPGPGLRYRFVHALVQATIYSQISRARRALQHRRVGEAIEAVHAGHPGEHLPELAFHFGEAAVEGSTDQAISYAHAAGNAALAQLAHDEAVHFYQRALGFLRSAGRPDEVTTARRAELLVLLGEAQRRAGLPEFRTTLLEGAELAESLGDGTLLTKAALANNRGFFSLVGSVDAERVEVLQRALAALGPGDSKDRARLLAQLGTELIFAGDWEARAALSDQALAMARALGEPATIVHVLNLRFVTLWGAPTLGERLAMGAEARDLAVETSDPVPAFYAACFGVHAALETGDLASADALLATAGDLAGGLGQPILDWYVAVTAAKVALVRGPLGDAEQLAFDALAVGQNTGQPDAFLWATVQLKVLRQQQGRTAEVLPLIEAAYLAQPFAGSVPMFTRASLATCYCDVGRLDEARSLLDALAADAFADMPCDFGWLATAALAAEVCWKVGGSGQAAAIYALLVPYRDQFVDAGPGWLGSVAHYVGLVAAVMGRIEEAEGAFARAAEAHARLGARSWLAITQAAWGGLLAGSGSSERLNEARKLLTEAQGTAAELGMLDLERQTSTRLADLVDPAAH